MKNRSSTWKTSRYQSFFLNRFSMSIYRYISRLEARLSVSQISSSIRYMCSIPSLNLDYSVERQNRNSITWNYMTMYEIFLISITEQSGKKGTVGTHTNTNCLLKINVHNKYIVPKSKSVWWDFYIIIFYASFNKIFKPILVILYMNQRWTCNSFIMSFSFECGIACKWQRN